MTADHGIEAQLASIAMGDRDAFRALYTATAPRLFGICLRILTDRAEAEDVLQSVYCRIWQGADRRKFSDMSAMVWLITLTRDMAVDRARTQSPRPAAPEPVVAPLGGHTSGNGAARLMRVLDTLPSDQATMIRRAYLNGDTYHALARATGVDQATLRPWMRRALVTLRGHLSK